MGFFVCYGIVAVMVTREKWLGVLRDDLERYWSVRGVPDVEGLVSEAIVSRVLPLLSGDGFENEQHFRNTCRKYCHLHILSLLRREPNRLHPEELVDVPVPFSGDGLLVRDAMRCWVLSLGEVMARTLRFKLSVLGVLDEFPCVDDERHLLRKLVRHIDSEARLNDGG